jgi:hypothetical protein
VERYEKGGTHPGRKANRKEMKWLTKKKKYKC